MSDYRLDTETGKMYTWEEWWKEWAQTIGDSGVLGHAYDKLPVVKTEGLDVEEVRRKMLFVYGKIDLRKGDLIGHNLVDDTYVVTHIMDGDIYTYKMATGDPYKWIGSYVKLGNYLDPSMVDKMKPVQIQYNIAMNNYGSINNSIDSTVPPLDDLGGNDL